MPCCIWIGECFELWRRRVFAAGNQRDGKKKQRAGRSERSHVAHHVEARLAKLHPFQDDNENTMPDSET